MQDRQEQITKLRNRAAIFELLVPWHTTTLQEQSDKQTLYYLDIHTLHGYS